MRGKGVDRNFISSKSVNLSNDRPYYTTTISHWDSTYNKQIGSLYNTIYTCIFLQYGVIYKGTYAFKTTNLSPKIIHIVYSIWGIRQVSVIMKQSEIKEFLHKIEDAIKQKSTSQKEKMYLRTIKDNLLSLKSITKWQ